MFRGYRFIFLGVAGLILIGASPSNLGNTQSKNTESGKAVDGKPATANAARPEQPITPRPDEGCERGQDNRKSDLCAQWKAADAARESANWTWWQIWIGVVGIVLGAVTMGAAIAAALYAKRAAIATEETVGIAKEAASGADAALSIAGRNADAAVKLVEQSEQTARRQLQAYAHISFAEYHHGFGDSDAMHILLAIGNHGQTPAKVVRMQLEIIWAPIDATEKQYLIKHDLQLNVMCYKDLPVRLPFKLSIPQNYRVKGQIIVEGCLFYTDVFEANRKSGFIFTSVFERFFQIEDGHRLTYVADEMDANISE